MLGAVAVVRALRAYVERCRADAKPTDLMFVDAEGAPYDASKLADRFRSSLRRAKVTRPELFDSTEARGRIRVHDLRGTFVTLSLANGRSESWVSDRTGHRSSVMINRYRRAARTASELGLGGLSPLDQAIPELLRIPHIFPTGGNGGQRHPAQVHESTIQSRSGGMADAADSKSVVFTDVWVQVPPSAPAGIRLYSRSTERTTPRNAGQVCWTGRRATGVQASRRLRRAGNDGAVVPLERLRALDADEGPAAPVGRCVGAERCEP